MPRLTLDFKEKSILYGEIMDDDISHPIPPSYKRCWDNRKPDDMALRDAAIRNEGVDKFFNCTFVKADKIVPTLAAKPESTVAYHKPSFLSDTECVLASSFPMDYDFCGQKTQLCLRNVRATGNDGTSCQSDLQTMVIENLTTIVLL